MSSPMPRQSCRSLGPRRSRAISFRLIAVPCQRSGKRVTGIFRYLTRPHRLSTGERTKHACANLHPDTLRTSALISHLSSGLRIVQLSDDCRTTTCRTTGACAPSFYRKTNMGNHPLHTWIEWYST